MTLRGVLVVLLEVLMVILAFGTEFKNFLIIALCIGGLLIYSLFSLILASITLGVKSNVDASVVQRGGKVSYTLMIRGVALLPVASYFFVKEIGTKTYKRRKFRHSVLLLPNFSVKRQFVFDMECVHVGDWEIGISKIRVEDLFGFFSVPVIRSKRSDLVKKITVTPKIYDFIGISARDSSGGFGSTNLSNCENGELLGDSRLYTKGDTLKRINWKLSARTKKLHSRMFETPQEPTVTIVMDKSICGSYPYDIVDISCETVLSLANYFIKHNTAVKLVFARGKEMNINSFDLQDQSDLQKIYGMFTNSIFAMQKEELNLSFFEGMQILNSNRVYFVTYKPSDELISTFSDINKMGKIACCIVPCGISADGDTVSAYGARDVARISITSADQIEEKVGEVL